MVGGGWWVVWGVSFSIMVVWGVYSPLSDAENASPNLRLVVVGVGGRVWLIYSHFGFILGLLPHLLIPILFLAMLVHDR